MAIPTINFAGYLYDDAGEPVSGATVNLFAKNLTATSLANDTTDPAGRWDINYTTAGTAGLDTRSRDIFTREALAGMGITLVFVDEEDLEQDAVGITREALEYKDSSRLGRR